MLDILVISPFRYALRKKCEDVSMNLFCDDITNYKVHAIYALPDDIQEKIHGKSFDFAYIDIFYSSDEISSVRDHLRGDKKSKLF
jgi:hypothetical protein